jgi:hypothetical protein
VINYPSLQKPLLVAGGLRCRLRDSDMPLAGQAVGQIIGQAIGQMIAHCENVWLHFDEIFSQYFGLNQLGKIHRLSTRAAQIL